MNAAAIAVANRMRSRRRRSNGACCDHKVDLVLDGCCDGRFKSISNQHLFDKFFAEGADGKLSKASFVFRV